MQCSIATRRPYTKTKQSKQSLTVHKDHSVRCFHSAGWSSSFFPSHLNFSNNPHRMASHICCEKHVFISPEVTVWCAMETYGANYHTFEIPNIQIWKYFLNKRASQCRGTPNTYIRNRIYNMSRLSQGLINSFFTILALIPIELSWTLSRPLSRNGTLTGSLLTLVLGPSKTFQNNFWRHPVHILTYSFMI